MGIIVIMRFVHIDLFSFSQSYAPLNAVMGTREIDRLFAISHTRYAPNRNFHNFSTVVTVRIGRITIMSVKSALYVTVVYHHKSLHCFVITRIILQ